MWFNCRFDNDKDDDGSARRRFHPAAIVAMVLGGLALAVGFAFLFGWIVMLLWNWLMPGIFGLPRIGYWQGWGLVLLSHILIKPGYPSHGDSKGERGSRRGRRDHWKDAAKDRFSGYREGPDMGRDADEGGEPSGGDAAGDANDRGDR